MLVRDHSNRLMGRMRYATSPSTLSSNILYSTNFGVGVALPAGWTTDPGNDPTTIIPNSTSPSSGYSDPQASGSGNLLFYDTLIGAFFSPQIIVLNTGTLSTLGKTNIKMKWGGMTTSGGGFPGILVEYSTDGIVWTTIGNSGTYDIPLIDNDGIWTTIIETTLPNGANGVANLQFRFSFNITNSGSSYFMDDFRVIGS